MGFGGFYSGGDSASNTTNNNQHYETTNKVTDESDKSVNTTTQSGVAAGHDLIYNVTDGGAMSTAGRVLESGISNLSRNVDTAFVTGEHMLDSAGSTILNGQMAQLKSFDAMGSNLLQSQLEQLKSAGLSASSTSQTANNAIAAMASLKGDSSSIIGKFVPLIFAVIALGAVYLFTRK